MEFVGKQKKGGSLILIVVHQDGDGVYPRLNAIDGDEFSDSDTLPQFSDFRIFR